jgi:predicted HNH restriction endonuclease
MFTEFEYHEALRTLELSTLQGEMLSALHMAGERGQSPRELAELLGMASYTPLNSALGRLGHTIAEFLGGLPAQRKDGSYRWWRVLAEGFHVQGRGFVWSLHPQVRAALAGLHWQAREYRFRPEEDEAPAHTLLREGKVIAVLSNAYERNAAARRRCIAAWGSACSVCAFNFAHTYGDLGMGFIHVHHLVPLGSIQAEYSLDPVNDLRPVCPNCHAMLHRKNPPLSIEELRQTIEHVGQRASQDTTSGELSVETRAWQA